MKDIIHLSINGVHKECTLSGKALFLNNIKWLKLRLFQYTINPFGERPAKEKTTEKDLDKGVVQELIYVPTTSNKKFIIKFVEERLVNGTIDFF